MQKIGHDMMATTDWRCDRSASGPQHTYAWLALCMTCTSISKWCMHTVAKDVCMCLALRNAAAEQACDLFRAQVK